MKRFYPFILFISFMPVFISCSDAGSEREKVAFEVSSDGTYSAISEKKEMLINNDNDYQSLMNEVYRNLDQMPRIPVIDFGKNSLVAVFIGTRSSGGYLVNIGSISESSKSINIDVNETIPGKTCIVSDVLTAPYTIVKIPKTDKKPVFKYRQTVKECQ